MPNEDTSRIALQEVKDKLAQVSAILERGRITREKRSIEKSGAWFLGSIYKTDSLDVVIYVASKSSSEPMEPIKQMKKLVYVGIDGLACIHFPSGYVRLGKGVTATVDPGQAHYLEPIENNTHLLSICIG